MNYKNYNVNNIELAFTGKLWERKELTNNSYLLFPKYMVNSAYQLDIESIRDAYIPYIYIQHNDSKIESLEAFCGATREQPILYSHNSSRLVLAESFDSIKTSLISLDRNELSMIEFLLFGYVLSNRTLVKDAFSLQAGELLVYRDKKFTIQNRYIYNTADIVKESKKERFKKLNDISETVFHELIMSLKGRDVILPLSGGYDSRFIAAMLKLGGYENVTCYGWGVPGHRDIERSRSIAKKLGYKWKYVEMSERKWGETISSRSFEDTLLDSSNLITIGGMANYFFSKYLNSWEQNSYSVVLQGHTFAASGGKIPNQLSKRTQRDSIIDFIVKSFAYNLKNYPVDYIKDSMQQQIRKYSFFDKMTYRYFETWDIFERSSKKNAICNHYYESINMPWIVPLYNIDFLKYWETLTLEEKKGKSLYKEYLDSCIFSKLDLTFAKRKKISSNIRNSIKSAMWVKRYLKKRNPSFGKGEYNFSYAFPLIYEKVKKRHNKSFRDLENFFYEYKIESSNYLERYLSQSLMMIMLDDY